MFSKADKIGMQTYPEKGTLQQTSLGLEEESKMMSASRFLLPLRGYTKNKTNNGKQLICDWAYLTHLDVQIIRWTWGQPIARTLPAAVSNTVEINTLRLRQNDQHLQATFSTDNVWILIQILLKFIPRCPLTNIPALVQIMARCQRGDKPLSEPMMVSLLTHICTRPRWVKLGRSFVRLECARCSNGAPPLADNAGKSQLKKTYFC